MRRDYYAVLGIAATAGSREIRQAYRRLARQYSPDVNLWDEEARSPPAICGSGLRGMCLSGYLYF